MDDSVELQELNFPNPNDSLGDGEEQAFFEVHEHSPGALEK